MCWPVSENLVLIEGLWVFLSDQQPEANINSTKECFKGKRWAVNHSLNKFKLASEIFEI